MSSARPERVTIEQTDITCLCGNDATNEGFDMSDPAGVTTDPDSGDWDGIHYRCARCGRVINQNTGFVLIDGMTPARRHFIAEMFIRDAEVTRANEQHGTYSDEYRRALHRWTRAKNALERITRAETGDE